MNKVSEDLIECHFMPLQHLNSVTFAIFPVWWCCFSISDSYVSSPVALERKGLLSGLWWQQDVGLTFSLSIMTPSKTQIKLSSAYDLMLFSFFLPTHITRGKRDRYTLLLSQIRPIINVFEGPRHLIPKAKMKALAWSKEPPLNNREWETIISAADTKPR